MSDSKNGIREKGDSKRREVNGSLKFVGKPVNIHSVYDFVRVDGSLIAFLSKFGTFEKNSGIYASRTGQDKRLMDEWFLVSSRNFVEPQATRWHTPKQSPEFLLHYPEFTPKIRFARLGLLYLKIRSIIEKTIRFESKDILNAVSLWPIAAHFHRVFNHFPILDFIKAGYNTGGSVALKTVLAFSPRPVVVLHPTESSLFRIAEEFTTNLDAETRNAILSLLDGSFDREPRIPRTISSKVKTFDMFGPRAVVDPHGLLGKYSTNSRALVAPLVNDPNMQSNADNLIEENWELIQALYDSFLVYSEDVKLAYDNCRITGDGRIDQAFRPLMAVALILKKDGVDIIQSLIKAIQWQFENLQAVRIEGDINKSIFAAIEDFVVHEKREQSWTKKTTMKGKNVRYVRMTNLRNVVSDQLGIEYQSDTSKKYGKRYWSRPSKEIGELIQDTIRFNAMLRNFLPDNLGQVEPGSRNLCLYWGDNDTDANSLIGRLDKLIGIQRASSDNPTEFLQVRLHTEPVLDDIIYNNRNRILHPRNYNYNIGKGKKNSIYSPDVGYLLSMFQDYKENAGSSVNPTSMLNVGIPEKEGNKDSDKIEYGTKDAEGEKEFRGIIEDLKNRGLIIDEEHSNVDLERNRILIMVLQPDLSTDIMKELGFELLNWTKKFGALYEKKMRGELET